MPDLVEPSSQPMIALSAWAVVGHLFAQGTCKGGKVSRSCSNARIHSRKELLAPPLSCLLPPGPSTWASCLLATSSQGWNRNWKWGLETRNWKLELKVDGWTPMESEMGPWEEGSFFAEAVTLTIPRRCIYRTHARTSCPVITQIPH